MSRENQKERTRVALVEAAATLVKEGRALSVAEVAEVAKVSTATAYRYFPNPQSLWADLAVKWAQNFHIGELLTKAGDDPGERMDTLIRYVTNLQFQDEVSWRALVKANLERWFEQGGSSPEAPVRGKTRIHMTQQALEPLEGVLTPEAHRRLKMALMLVYGVEAMIVTRDACDLEPDEATEVMRWAAQALVQAAMKDS